MPSVSLPQANQLILRSRETSLIRKRVQKFVLCAAAGLSVLLASPGSYGSVSYHYYLPYFTQTPGCWTGTALSNCSATQTAQVTVTVYGENGDEGGALVGQLPPRGQQAFVPQSTTIQEGWMAVDSDQPLTGFVLVGTESVIADVTLVRSLAATLHVPHAAQNAWWDTSIFVCNPHAVDLSLTVTFVTSEGQEQSAREYFINARGSIRIALAEVLGGIETSGGRVELSASQTIAGFALYSNAKVGGYGYAGISAVAPEGSGSIPCNVEIYPGSSCARLNIGASFATVRSLYGAPSSTGPSDTEWINYFWYDELGISGAVNDENQDEILDDAESLFMVIVASPYEGTTSQCNGIGSSRTGVESEFGVCDYSEYSNEWGGMLELYEEGIGFVYDAEDRLTAVAVFAGGPVSAGQGTKGQRAPPHLLRLTRILRKMSSRP